ncbi:MAG: two-component system sensor histidine kinase/response regulator [Lysobacterales bacterium]|jgi:two-component system sensor histidine kinase/response regulator
MNKKILLVDDDPIVVKIIMKLLVNNNYDIDLAKDGLDALVMIKENPPDLVILDVMMPEVNGYDVCYQLRFNDDYKKVPIILLTVRDRELVGDISERVDIEYIQKPIDIKVMSEKIELLLSKTE